MTEDSSLIVGKGMPQCDFKEIGEGAIKETPGAKANDQLTTYPLIRALRGMVSELFSSSKQALVAECYVPMCVEEVLKSGVVNELDIASVLASQGIQLGVKSRNIPRIFSRKALMDIIISLIPTATVAFMGKRSMGLALVAASPVVAMLLSWWPVWKAHRSYSELKYYINDIKKLHRNLRRTCELIDVISKRNEDGIFESAGAWQLEYHDLPNRYSISEKCLPGLRVDVIRQCLRLVAAYSEELQEQRTHRTLPFSVELPDARSQFDESIPRLGEIRESVESFLQHEKEYLEWVVLRLLISGMEQSFSLVLNAEILAVVQQAGKDLSFSYVIYKTVYCNNETSSEEARRSICQGYGPLESMCHSSCLHLESALKGAIDLGTKIANSDPQVWEDVPVNLSKIEYHMDVAKGNLNSVSILHGRESFFDSDTLEPTVPRESQDSSVVDEKIDVLLDLAFTLDEVDDLVGDSGRAVTVETGDEWNSESDRTNLDSFRIKLIELKNALEIEGLVSEEEEGKLSERTQSIKSPMHNDDTVESVKEAELKN